MTSVFVDDQVRAMERAAARAWPAAHSVTVNGWTVRLSGGGARRANSVLPLDFSGPFNASVASVEALYRVQQARCYFQVSSMSEPHDLDDRLAALGYTAEEPCLLLAKPSAPAALPKDVQVMATPSPAWFEVYAATLDNARKTAAAGVLAAIPEPRAFLLLMRDGQALSTALVALSSDGIAIVECVATRSEAQRSGGAHSVMTALEAWAAAHGAHTVALQVVANNQPARALYARRGYVEVGRYHYRWRNV